MPKVELDIVLLMCRYASDSVNKLLVGNKNDLTSQRAVSFEQGKVCVCQLQQFNLYVYF